MSLNDTFALIALMLGVVTFAAILSGAFKRHLAFRERKLELAARHAAEQAAQYATQNATLEARVRVLERIATGADALGSRDLAAEIEALRH